MQELLMDSINNNNNNNNNNINNINNGCCKGQGLAAVTDNDNDNGNDNGIIDTCDDNFIS